MKWIIFALPAVFVISLSGIAPPVWAEEKKDAKQLFESKCRICHSVKKPKSKRKTKKGWRETVTRMKDARKAPITDDEAEIIIDYLSQRYGK